MNTREQIGVGVKPEKLQAYDVKIIDDMREFQRGEAFFPSDLTGAILARLQIGGLNISKEFIKNILVSGRVVDDMLMARDIDLEAKFFAQAAEKRQAELSKKVSQALDAQKPKK